VFWYFDPILSFEIIDSKRRKTASMIKSDVSSTPNVNHTNYGAASNGRIEFAGNSYAACLGITNAIITEIG
jgi:hypothetical protein